MPTFLQHLKKQKIFILCIKSFLVSYALTVPAFPPLMPHYFDNFLLLIIESIILILGGYSFYTILCFGISYIFFLYMDTQKIEYHPSTLLLAILFSTFLLLGQSYEFLGNWNYLFGSIINFINSLLSLMGYGLIFYYFIALTYKFFDHCTLFTTEKHKLSNHTFPKVFILLALAYLPPFILCYPGNLCWDSIGQIEQVLLELPYSTHHPLLITLWMGGLVKLGGTLFNSYELGLYLYLITQAIVFISALSATITVLAKKMVHFKLLVTLIILYICTPIYWNVITTPLKDVPFVSFFIGYFICFSLALTTPSLRKRKGFIGLFILLQIATILSRNNGLYVILLSSIGGILILRTTQHISKKEILLNLFTFGGISILSGKLITSLLALSLSASSGSIGEMLSIPFQQTALYVIEYKEDLSLEEITAIETVLGDIESIITNYNPAIADPIKANFIKTSTATELFAYLKVWINGLFKHPDSYFQAFFVHVYGWFSPLANNSVRYNATSELLEQNLLFPYANTFLRFLYSIVNSFSFLGILENIGIYVWCLFLISIYLLKNKLALLATTQLPLWISLLVCMASPVFFGHPRYALPILTTIPFTIIFTLVQKQERTS